MSFRRVVTIAEMQARDLARRRAAMALLVALPLLFYVSMRTTSEDFALIAGGIGMGWSLGSAGLFLTLASRRADVRLVLSGYRAAELLLGRLAFLALVGVALVALFSVLMIVGSSPPRPGLVVLGVALTALTSIPLGPAIAALVPRELEGALTLIGIVGIEMSLSIESPVASALPLYGAMRSLDAAGGAGDVSAAAIVHALVTAGALISLGAVLFHRRARVRRRPATVRAD